MGHCESKEKTPNSLPKSRVDLYKLMKGGSYFNEQNTINFSRKDFENTLSDRSILDIMQGGGEKLKNYPKRDRYSKYETQQIKNNNQNLWGGHQLSTVSDQEMQTLRNLITQNGGGCGVPQNGGCGCGTPELHQTGGCGCGENSVLNGGFINNNKLNGSVTSSFMPNIASDLSATSNNSIGNSGSATSSFMPNIASDLSATSVSVNQNDQRGGLSTTSTFNNSELVNSEKSIQLGSISSSTSEFASDKQLHYNPDLQQFQINSYQPRVQYNNNNNNNNNNNDSAIERLTNLVGNNIQMGGGLDNLSTSSQPVKYENLIESGWGKKSKKQKGGAKSSSSSVTSSTSSESSSTGSSERRDKSEISTSALLGRTESETEKAESVKSSPSESSPSESSPSESSPTESSSTTPEKSTVSRMSRVNTTESKSTRSAKASSSSSSGSTPSSQSFGNASDSSSSSGSTFGSSSSSTSRSANSKTVKRNIYLSTTASEGNVIDAKQFYSSDQGELYSSDTNFLRHNLTKRRFR